MRCLLLIAALFVSVALSSQVNAAPINCPSILALPEINSENGRSNEAIKLIIHSRFVAGDFAAASSDIRTGFGVPSGTVVFGSTFDAPRYQQRKDYMSVSFKHSVPAAREVDVAIASGLPGVLDAWKSCATDQGGISVRFEPQTQTDAFAFIEFFGASNTRARLISDIGLPTGVTAVSGAECLRSGREFVVDAPCLVVLSLVNPQQSMLMVANTDKGIAVGYLAARVKISTERLPFPFTPSCNLTLQSAQAERDRCSDRLYASVSGSSKQVRNIVSIPGNLPATLAGQGWEFDSSTTKIKINTLQKYSPSNTTSCRDAVSVASWSEFTYGYLLKSGVEHGQNASVTCTADPSVDMVRPTWVAAG